MGSRAVWRRRNRGVNPVAGWSARAKEVRLFGLGQWALRVTHRFSTVAAADLVVVLADGCVAEIGTHAELIAARGRYAELYELQARG